MRWLIEPSHLDLCCLQKPIIITCGSERVKHLEFKQIYSEMEVFVCCIAYNVYLPLVFGEKYFKVLSAEFFTHILGVNCFQPHK